MTGSQFARRGPACGRVGGVALLMAAVVVCAAVLAWMALRDGDDPPPGAGDAPDVAASRADRPRDARSRGADDTADAPRPGDPGGARRVRAAPATARPDARPDAGPGRAAGDAAPGAAGASADGGDPAAQPGAGAPSAAPADGGATAAGRSDAARRAPGRAARGAAIDATPRTLVTVVTAAETGAPLGAAEVVVTDASGHSARARTTSDGRAMVTLPSSLPVTVDVKLAGRVRVFRDDVAVPAPTSSIAISLDRGVVVVGAVRGSGAPVAGAALRAYDAAAYWRALPYGPEPRPIETTVADRKGRYRLDCIPRGVACVLVTEAAGFADVLRKILPQPDADYVVRADVALERSVEIRGIVETVGKDGVRTPVEGARVFAIDRGALSEIAAVGDRGVPGLDAPDAAEVDCLEWIRLARSGRASRRFCAWTAADGAFRIVVPANVDWCRLIAMHPASGRSTPMTVKSPGRAAVSLELRGRVQAWFDVLRPDGKRAEGVTVTPYLPWETWTVRISERGLHGPADMDDGVTLVRVASKADAPGALVGRRIALDRLVWTVKLLPGVRVAGVVVDDLGRLIAGATVTAGERTTTTDADGRFELNGVREDVGVVIASAPGHVPSELALGTHQERVPVRLRRTSPLRLRLRLPNGARIPSWRRVAHSRRPWVDDFAWNDGVIELPDADGAEGDVTVFVPGYEMLSREVQAKPGVERNLGDIELVPAKVLRGVVLNEDGAAVPGAQVSLRWRDPWEASGFVPERSVDTDARGAFSIEVAVPDGTWDAVVSGAGYAETPQRVWVRESAVQQVVIGRGRMFRGRISYKPGRVAWATLLGPSNEEYAVTPIDESGTYEAEVPIWPTRVSFRFDTKWSSTVVTENVYPDWADRPVIEMLDK